MRRDDEHEHICPMSGQPCLEHRRNWMDDAEMAELRRLATMARDTRHAIKLMLKLTVIIGAISSLVLEIDNVIRFFRR